MTQMTSTYAFLNRLSREPLFIADYQPSNLAIEPKPGDIATVHTADQCMQIKIETTTGCSYLGEIIGATNRRTHTVSEVHGSRPVAFAYAHIVAFASSRGIAQKEE
jgi:hypothetical protein